MSQEIAAEIVRRALAPAPIGDDGRPRETPLEERLRLLHHALGGTQQRVGEQQRKLEALRCELDEYRALMERVKQRAVEAQRAAQLLATAPAPRPEPEPEPPPEPALPLDAAAGAVDLEAPAPVAASVPEPVAAPLAAPRPLEEALTPRLRYAQFAPYVAIALFGAAMSYMVTRRPAPTLPALKTADVPPPSVARDLAAAADTPDGVPSDAAEKPAPGEDVSNAVILNLISSFVPPGGKRSVSDILGPEMDDPDSDSPWTLMRVDPHTVMVSFHPYGDVLDNAPVYEFTVDPIAKTVTATDETLADLRGGSVASAR